MSDKNDKQEQESEDETQAPFAGERLADARREQQIPVLAIAKELHLDEYKVRALESNDFEVIGAPVFAKGHLKNYAQIVKVDDTDFDGRILRTNACAAGQPPLSVRAKQRRAYCSRPVVGGDRGGDHCRDCLLVVGSRENQLPNQLPMRL